MRDIGINTLGAVVHQRLGGIAQGAGAVDDVVDQDAAPAGDIAGRRALLVDDIVDSAGTLCNAAEALMDSGAEGVYAYVTHGVLSGGAVARVAGSPIKELVLTDSIVATEAVRLSRNIRQLTIAPLMAEAILRISEERSVSSLFD